MFSNSINSSVADEGEPALGGLATLVQTGNKPETETQKVFKFNFALNGKLFQVQELFVVTNVSY